MRRRTVRHLGEDRDYDPADTSADRPEAMHMDRDDQAANRGLDIEGIASEPVDRGNMEGITFADVA